DLVAQYANDVFPRLTFFIADEAGNVRRDDQRVTPPGLAEDAVTKLPSTLATGQIDHDFARRFAGEPWRDAELLGVLSRQSLGMSAEQPLAGGIDEAESFCLVEGENRSIDSFDDFA